MLLAGVSKGGYNLCKRLINRFPEVAAKEYIEDSHLDEESLRYALDELMVSGVSWTLWFVTTKLLTSHAHKTIFRNFGAFESSRSRVGVAESDFPKENFDERDEGIRSCVRGPP